MEWKPLQDWTEPIRRLLKSQSPVSTIHICTEQSTPHKIRKVCFLRIPVCSLFILIWHRFCPLSPITNHQARPILRSELVPAILHPYQNQRHHGQYQWKFLRSMQPRSHHPHQRLLNIGQREQSKSFQIIKSSSPHRLHRCLFNLYWPRRIMNPHSPLGDCHYQYRPHRTGPHQHPSPQRSQSHLANTIKHHIT
jgi:hypothetical protein